MGILYLTILINQTIKQIIIYKNMKEISHFCQLKILIVQNSFLIKKWIKRL